jgi:protein-S-isoprenylcysteine O-methyltransferase Ste14
MLAYYRRFCFVDSINYDARRMAALLLFRVSAAVAVALVFGGRASLRHPVLIAYLVLEAALSMIEGRQARVSRPAKAAAIAIPPAQFPFVISGKQYLLARLLYHAGIVAAFALRPPALHLAPIAIAGAALMTVGVALRGWSMATLGERFRSFEARRESRGLETSGPYALIRHPGYLALAFIDLGAPLLLGVPWLTIAWAVPAALVVRRVVVEEPLLASNYPESWPAYSARTWRLVPGVW